MFLMLSVRQTTRRIGYNTKIQNDGKQSTKATEIIEEWGYQIHSVLKIDAVYFSETLVYAYESTWRYNPEDRQQHHSFNFFTALSNLRINIRRVQTRTIKPNPPALMVITDKE
jgi:hypothetical protein